MNSSSVTIPSQSIKGSPLRKEGALLTFVYQLFDEDCAGRCYGIFYPNLTKKVGVNFTDPPVYGSTRDPSGIQPNRRSAVYRRPANIQPNYLLTVGGPDKLGWATPEVAAL
ncbi:hypothetical protein RHMOL_Rhmol06G0016500 [Rhododendron molle]|uniref:Uncharacterized protein n=1 Tax=Rhododendron molle TaxID=49168 RepID=A0ACC0N8V4_RHOML|nr:hypothetical protein RHMOL_Rhmol06G0016500 [Rhododendron molle]